VVDNNDLESVRAYFKLHKQEIMQRYKAHGIAIGKKHLSDTEYVIVVYLENNHEVPQEPVTLDGIELKFEVTGPFILQK
jgi:hypothetical protein